MIVELEQPECDYLLMVLWNVHSLGLQMMLEEEISVLAISAEMQTLDRRRRLVAKLGGDPDLPLYGLGAPETG